MKYLQLLVLSLFIFGCAEKTDPKDDKEQETSTTPKTPAEEKAELTVVKGHSYVEYYPGKKNIKFQGVQDDEGRRHGLWTYFSEAGAVLITTMYEHGKKHGHMIVKRPNGALYYYGEMHHDKKIGVWKNYDEDGVFLSDTDFGEAE